MFELQTIFIGDTDVLQRKKLETYPSNVRQYKQDILRGRCRGFESEFCNKFAKEVWVSRTS